MRWLLLAIGCSASCVSHVDRLVSGLDQRQRDDVAKVFDQCPKTRKKRPSPLVHYHIAKNGGTTLREILKRYDARELHGPKKKPYATYFHSDKEKWRGTHFVTFVREPGSKLLSQFYYARAALGGSFGRWHRCIDFGEYVESRKARHNHQFSQLIAGHPGCGTPSMTAPRHEAKSRVEVEDVCPTENALRARIAQILGQPRLFVGVLERFDESLLALSKEFALPDVGYCRQRSNLGSLKETRDQVLSSARLKNKLDRIIVNITHMILDWKSCCFGITPQQVNQFSILNHKRHCVKSRTLHLDNTTIGNPAWRDDPTTCSS